MREVSASTNGLQGIAQTVRWSCKPIILSIGRFESPTEVQLNSLQNASSLWLWNSLKKQANFIEIITNFFNGWFGYSFISKELAL